MYDFSDQDDQVTLESLTHQHAVISMETSTPGATFSAMSAKFPKFLGDVKSFLSGALTPFQPKAQLVDSRNLERMFSTVNYMNAQSLAVYVPAGYKGYWLDYVEVLAKGQTVLSNVQTQLLKPFEVWLALLLNTPVLLADLAAPATLARYKAPDMEGLRKEFGAFFTSSTNTESTYGQVVKRHADLPFVTRNLNDTNQRFVAIDRKVLIHQVEEVVTLLNTLMTNAKENPEAYRISGANARMLSDMTYYVAQEIAFYSTFGYQLEAFTTAVNDSYKRMEKNLNP